MLVLLISCMTSAHAGGMLILRTKNISPYNEAIEGFKEASHFDTTEFDLSNLDASGLLPIDKIRSLEPDVIVAVGTTAARLAAEQIRDVPVIFCMVLDPPAALGPNMTGVTLRVPSDKIVEVARQVLPHATTLGVLSDGETTDLDWARATDKAQELDFDLIVAMACTEEEVPDKLSHLLTRGIDILWLPPGSKAGAATTFAQVVAMTGASGVPIIASQPAFVRAGALMSVAPSYKSMGMQAARMATRIIGGARISDLPVEPPERPGLALNQTVARRFGLELRMGSELMDVWAPGYVPEGP